MIFTYKIYNPEGKMACIGRTVQVFVNFEDELALTLPPFFEAWKRKEGILK